MQPPESLTRIHRLNVVLSNSLFHLQILRKPPTQLARRFPVALGAKAGVRERSTFRSVTVENVAGILRGTHRGHINRFVVISAHFDHLSRDEKKGGDQIYNGAVDNCSASALMMALARYYSQRPEELKINLLFLAATAEEVGFFGSDPLITKTS